MIKRPLLWVLGAYFTGICFAWYKAPYPVLFCSVVILLFLIYLFMFHIPNPLIQQIDSFLWFLPFLIMLGFFSMHSQMARPEIDKVFDDKAECMLTGKITMIVEKSWGKAFYVTHDRVYLSRESPYLCENVIVYSSDNQTFQVGNSIKVYGTLLKFSAAENPGQFNEQMYYQMENIDYKMKANKILITDQSYSRFHAVLDWMKKKLMSVYQGILGDKESGALIAMLLGEKQLLDDEIKQLYQENGIAHVLAISGLHVSLIGITIYMLLKKLKIGIIPATVFSILFIYSYGVLTNFSVSTNRAVVMIIIMMLAKIFGKTYDMLSSMALSAFLILLQNPMQLFQAGFLLSFGAVFGIAVLMPCFKLLFTRDNKIVDGLFISISAQAITTPMVLYYFYQFPVYCLIVNLLILPFMSIEILAALAAGIIGMVSMPLGIFAIGATNYILKFTEWICRVGSSLPGNLLTTGRPEMGRIIIYGTLIALFIWSVRKYQKKILLLIFAASIIVLLFPKHSGGMEITMLSVGQGDALYMRTESGTNYFIDGGSTDIKDVGKYRIQPFLLSKGVDKIDYAIISHSDFDHNSGIRELMLGTRIKIKALVLPKINKKDDNYKSLEALAKDNKVTIIYMSAGETIKDGSVRMECLHPSPGYEAPSVNAYSLVLSVSYHDFDMLFTGDLEKDGEAALVDQYSTCHEKTENIDRKHFNLKDYDVLKVAHHGSKNSTYPDFLTITQPEYALISCGKNNRYGHPNKELIERLKQVKSNIKISYQCGAVTIRTDGRKMRISDYIKRQ